MKLKSKKKELLTISRYLSSVILVMLFFLKADAQKVDSYGEPFAEDILNNVWKWPASPPVENTLPDLAGFAANRLGNIPKPGVHPRILFSPKQIPDIKYRILNTISGKLLLQNLHRRTSIFDNDKYWEQKVLNLLANGDWQSAKAILDTKPKPNGEEGHYQPYFIYELMLKSFDCLIFDKKEEGEKIALAFYNYTKIIKPALLDNIKTSPYPKDVWRSGGKEVMDYQFIAYCYDFTYNFLDNKQRDYIRDMISTYTYGRITLGMKIPPHFRNWNWNMVAQSFVLNALAIEGEKGYDIRVYKKSVEVVNSYLNYAISSQGMSTEAVGYTAFGFYWGCPAMIAMAKRGDNFLVHPHYKAMKNWYLNTLQPYGKTWTSHGDGGDTGPSVEQIMMMKYFYPDDQIVDYLWQNRMYENGPNTLLDKMNLIIPMICAIDPNTDKSTGKQIDYNYGAKLNEPLTFFDHTRASLNTRSDWSKDAAFFEMEARIDGTSASHEHADRGNFNFSALGRGWSLDGFRGVESKYHNVVLINGRGEGYFATPAKWIKTIDKDEATFGICDTKYAYDWRWPKPMEATTQLNDPKLKTDRYKGFIPGIERFKKIYGDTVFKKDPSANLVQHYGPYLKGSPKEWDEDVWPVRIPYNPVLRSFRTAGLVRGAHPYALIVDDIQKNNAVNLYEWNMMLEWDLDVISINGNDVILGKNNPEISNSDFNKPVSRKVVSGEPLLLVRVIDCSLPEPRFFDSNPSIRVETFEKVNTMEFRDRTFGLSKRLIIPSRSIAPNYKILLYPFRGGEALPQTDMILDPNQRKVLTITTADKKVKDIFTFKINVEGRSEINYQKDGKNIF